MKKIATITIILLFSVNLGAQTIYIKLFGGYGLSLQEELINLQSNYYFENQDTNYTSYAYESVKFSCGKGPKYGLAIGIDIAKNFAFELGGNYSTGKSSEISYEEDYSFDYDLNSDAKFTHKYNWESKSVQILPELIIKNNNTEITLYLKLGTIIGFTQIRENYELKLVNTIPGYFPFESWIQVLNYKMTPSIGFTTAIGCDFNILDNFYIFTEVKYYNLNCILKKGEIVEYKYRGEDKLETLVYNERYFEYVKAYSDSDNNNPNDLGKRSLQRFTLSNISAIFGFKFYINSKKASKIE